MKRVGFLVSFFFFLLIVFFLVLGRVDGQPFALPTANVAPSTELSLLA